MIYCVCYSLICLIFVVLQSTLLPVLLPSYLTYDLLLPVVVYLALFHPPVRAFFLLLIPGFMMDAVTGGPLGVYVLAYFWLFAGIRLAIHIFERDSLVVMIAAVVAGVALEHGVFWLAGRLSGSGVAHGIGSSGIVFGRMVTAGLTGPFLLLLFRRITDYIVPESRHVSLGTEAGREAGWHHI